MILIAVIAISLLTAGLLAGELYARHRAESVVAAAVECAVRNHQRVSFGTTPFLLQLATSHFTDISIHTAGNQIGDAQGMKADVWLDDVRISGAPGDTATVGALDMVITWSADGMNQSIQATTTPLRGLVTKVQADSDDGTLTLRGDLGTITTKPRVVGGRDTLQVADITGLSSVLPRNIVQSALDELTGRLTENDPIGIQADSVQITKYGVTAHYSSRELSIPRYSQADPGDNETALNEKPCFANF